MASMQLPVDQLQALTFGTANSDRVSPTTPSGWNNLTKFSLLMLIRPTTFTSGRGIMSKSNGSTIGWLFQLTGTSGAYKLLQVYATTNLNYVGNTNLTLNVWQWIACTLDTSQGATAKAHLYNSKNLWSPLLESGYSGRTDPVGALTDDSAQALDVANDGANTHAIQGQVAFAGFCPNVFLSLKELNDWRLNSYLLPRGCQMAYRLGRGGRSTLVRDFSGSGNPGTRTGAIADTKQGPSIVAPRTSQFWQSVAAAIGLSGWECVAPNKSRVDDKWVPVPY